MLIHRSTFFLTLALVCVACSNDRLPKYQTLDKLRILGIKADSPEVTPGATVNLTPIVSDPNGGARTITYSVETCLDPGVSYGADVTCAGDPARTTQSGTFTFLDAYRTAAGSSFSVTVPATVFAGRTSVEQSNGVAYLVVYRVSAGSDSASSFKRLIASTRTSKNSNPTLSSVQIAGADISALPGDEQSLSVVVGAGSSESYEVRSSLGTSATLSEQLTVSWFVNQGTLKYDRTTSDSSNKYTPDATASTAAGPFLFVILRDDRGGVDFKRVPTL